MIGPSTICARRREKPGVTELAALLPTVACANWAVVAVVAFFLLMMMHGNHQGRVEDWFLIGFAAFVLGVVARSWYVGRNSTTR